MKIMFRHLRKFFNMLNIWNYAFCKIQLECKLTTFSRWRRWWRRRRRWWCRSGCRSWSRCWRGGSTSIRVQTLADLAILGVDIISTTVTTIPTTSFIVIFIITIIVTKPLRGATWIWCRSWWWGWTWGWWGAACSWSIWNNKLCWLRFSRLNENIWVTFNVQFDRFRFYSSNFSTF